MTLYARVVDGQIVERRELEPSAIPAHKASWWRPIEGDPPSYDQFRQSLSGPFETVEESRVLRTWTVTDISADALRERVKMEARRRIVARFPDWKQSNMIARSAELSRIQSGLMRDANGDLVAARPPAEAELAEEQAINLAWAWIKAVRAASDAIEAMSPIPADYAADARWPA